MYAVFGTTQPGVCHNRWRSSTPQPCAARTVISTIRWSTHSLTDLSKYKVWPWSLPRTPHVSERNRPAEGLGERADVAREPIHHDQEWPNRRTTPHQRDELGNQWVITAGAHYATEPQMGRDHHGHRHPGASTLRFEPQLVGLDVAHVALPHHQVMLDGFGMGAGGFHPLSDRLRLNPNRGLDRHHWAAIRDEGQNLCHAISGGPTAIHRGAGTRAKGFATLGTAVALFFLTMNCEAFLRTALEAEVAGRQERAAERRRKARVFTRGSRHEVLALPVGSIWWPPICPPLAWSWPNVRSITKANEIVAVPILVATTDLEGWWATTCRPNGG